MIWIGNQTTCWTARIDEPFEYGLANGFDAFEWFPDKKPNAGWDEADLTSAERARIREMARAAGMRLSVHARGQASLLEPDSLSLLGKDIELTRDLGAVLLNVHLEHQAGLAAYVQALVPLLQRVADAKLQLSIENTPEHSPDLFNGLFANLRELNSDLSKHAGMCFDMGHANLCAATRNDYLRFLDELDPGVPIIHLHLHENWGDADTHLPLFTGPAGHDESGVRGLIKRLKRRGYSGSMILEQWPQPPALLNQARDRLRALLDAGGAPRTARSAPSLNNQPAVLTDESRPVPMGDEFAEALVAGDKQSRSWREKLQSVREFISKKGTELSVQDLTDVAIYLRFLGNGQIACVEDGRHFRPGHHARIALEIQGQLEQIASPKNVFVLRKIYPWLPSSASSFRSAEPLTRIRDIAHRNDIPSDLKREIKERLQNKLHRCAGPEDLVTSKELLERITVPEARYSAEFIEQFRIFHEELKEFFNARTLEERLKALLAAANSQQAELIQAFLGRPSGTGLGEKQDGLAALTELRASLVDRVQAQRGPDTVEFRMADLGLEDFAFALLSDITNRVETLSDPERWEPLLNAWRLAVKNLELSELAPEEYGAIGSELHAWQEGFDAQDREQLLRLKATADRTRRLAESYSDQILELFAPRVEKLGRALGVEEKARRVFAEAEIRAHLVFQTSKLISMVLAQIRARLGLPPWDVLVSGRTSGVLKAVDRLESLDSGEREHLVLLEQATGEEEIPRGVAALILGHSIPHLSHLGVRARQAGVILVASEEREAFEKLRKLEGQQIELRASAEAFAWQTGAVSGAKGKQAAPRPIRIPEAHLESKCRIFALEGATLEIAGGKADGARRLSELARRKGAGFETAPAAVFPFGAMEAALMAEPGVEKEYVRLMRETKGMPAERVSAAAEELRRLIAGLKVPQEIEAELERRFGTEARLMVRSSANAEDLEEMAGAGLYDSIANVRVQDWGKAVSNVWASLWTPRATLSREQAGIAHDKVRMAVLLQQMLAPDYSFVLHTVNPSSQNAGEIYVELAVGLGETLVSAGVPGSSYRLVCDKKTGATTTLAFASFSRARRCRLDGGVAEETVDYSGVDLSRDSQARSRLGRRLSDIGRLVEEAFGRPQDIEGAVIGGKIYLVQARAQQGLSP